MLCLHVVLKGLHVDNLGHKTLRIEIQPCEPHDVRQPCPLHHLFIPVWICASCKPCTAVLIYPHRSLWCLSDVYAPSGFAESARLASFARRCMWILSRDERFLRWLSEGVSKPQVEPFTVSAIYVSKICSISKFAINHVFIDEKRSSDAHSGP